MGSDLKLWKKNAVYVLLYVSYFSLSVPLLIVVKNLGHVLEHKSVKKAAFSLHSRTTPWLRRTSQRLHLRKTEQLRTSTSHCL